MRRWRATGAIVGGVLLIAAIGCTGPRPTIGPEANRIELDRIDAIERTRRPDEALRTLIHHENPHVRSRVYRALARMRSGTALQIWREGVTEETEPGVLVHAAFAAGQWAEWEAPRPMADRLLFEWTNHEFPEVRMAAWEALGERARKADPKPAWVVRLTEGLADPVPRVRGAAALALEGGGDNAVEALTTALATEGDEEVRWRIVYSLARRDEEATAEAVEPLWDDVNPWVRAFAARGMGSPPRVESVGVLGRLLADANSHWTARAIAVRSLGAIREQFDETQGAVRDLLLAQLQRETHGLVLECVIEGLSSDDEPELVRPFIVALTDHASLTVRRAALVALGQVVGAQRRAVGDRALEAREDEPAPLELLRARARADNPYERAAAVKAIAATGVDVWEDLDRALEDDARVVRTTAAEAATTLDTAERWDLLARLTRDDDLAVRAIAVTAFADEEEGQPLGWEERLVDAFHASDAPEYWETRKLVLESLASDRARAESLAQAALDDENPGVAAVARVILGLPPVPASTPEVPYRLLRREQVVAGDNPHLILATDRGRVVIELFLDVAPHHVSNIVHLARSGFYDGLPFHRVVPAFVVQGGDSRGDGWGDAGYALSHEVNRRPYLRGTLGMPTAGWDTGGCQIFITHLPTPRLDGAYTVFGQVVLGMEVIDAIEVGDRIESARLDVNQWRAE